MSRRIEKVNHLIQEQIGQILLQEIEFGQDILATVTKVQTLPNLQEAKVFISIMPPQKSKKVLEILNSQIYNLQQILNKRLRMRPVPKIKFEIDETASKIEKIENVINRIKLENY